MDRNWRQVAESADVLPVIVELLDEVDKSHGLHECARGGGGEVGMGAAPDAYAAVYVGKSGMSIALDPPVAKTLATTCELPLLAKTAATNYVRVKVDRLSDQVTRDRVSEALDAALKRSWHGPRWKRGIDDGKPVKLVPV